MWHGGVSTVILRDMQCNGELVVGGGKSLVGNVKEHTLCKIVLCG